MDEVSQLVVSLYLVSVLSPIQSLILQLAMYCTKSILNLILTFKHSQCISKFFKRRNQKDHLVSSLRNPFKQKQTRVYDFILFNTSCAETWIPARQCFSNSMCSNKYSIPPIPIQTHTHKPNSPTKYTKYIIHNIYFHESKQSSIVPATAVTIRKRISI